MILKNKDILNLLTGMECEFLYNNTDLYLRSGMNEENDIEKIFKSAIKQKENKIVENEYAIKGLKIEIDNLNKIKNKLLTTGGKNEKNK